MRGLTGSESSVPVTSTKRFEHSWRYALGRRYLDVSPTAGRRYFYLGIVVITSVVLYYVYYVVGAVTPLLLPYYKMSFLYFLYLLAVGNAIGAFTAFIGGLADRVGRANLTIYGTFVVAIVQFAAIPHIHSKFLFAASYCVIGFVEGIILVSTAALMRDFSPQMGRGAAMGFWALGPTMGSLLASLVATRTLNSLPPWQDQYIISGLICLGVATLSFFGLRELSPGIRSQIMVSEKERTLVEARARGVDVETATAHPIRSMMKLDLVSSSIGISLFLLFYFASVSVLTLYWVVIFSRTAADANGINTWYAAVLSVALIIFGAASDRLHVRKPFMLVGAATTIVMMILLVVQAGHPSTGYYWNVLIVVALASTIACAYAPWMAAYTEAVEARNPALVAAGLALWGWILRIVVALSFLVIPAVITTSTTLVDNQQAGSELQAFQAAQPYVPALSGATVTPTAPSSVIDQLTATKRTGPQTLALILEQYPRTSPALPNSARLLKVIATLPPENQAVAQVLPQFATALGAIQHGQTASSADRAIVERASPDDLGPLLGTAAKIVPAQAASPTEWRRWWWVCIGGQVVFLLLVFTFRGRWSPRQARWDLGEHERHVEELLGELRPVDDSSQALH
jgi:Major Facilitator Superfamily